MSPFYAAPPPTPQAAANPWLAQTVTIRRIRREIEGVATYDMAGCDPSNWPYRFAPGQFNMLYLPGAGEIAISVSGDPRDTAFCAHTVRVAGNVTHALAGMQVGDTLGLRGPFGTGWPLAECVGRDVVLAAGGIGLAPLRPVIYTLLRNRRQVGRINLVYGARSPDTLLYQHEFDEWVRRGIILHTTVDRSAPGWTGNVGVVTLLLQRLRSFGPSNTVLLCCGPEVMMKFTVKTALRRGVSPANIWVSMERSMQCAVGLCGRCQWGPEFICKDGPVLRYDRIASRIDIEAL